MNIVTEIQQDNPEDHTITIDKLFQVVFVGKPDNKQERKVKIFTAIAFRSLIWKEEGAILFSEKADKAEQAQT